MQFKEYEKMLIVLYQHDCDCVHTLIMCTLMPIQCDHMCTHMQYYTARMKPHYKAIGYV